MKKMKGGHFLRMYSFHTLNENQAQIHIKRTFFFQLENLFLQPTIFVYLQTHAYPQ